MWFSFSVLVFVCTHMPVCTGEKAIRLECKQNNDWGLINTSCPLCAQEQFMETTQLSLYREGTRQLVCKQASPTLPEPEYIQKCFHLDILPGNLTSESWDKDQTVNKNRQRSRKENIKEPLQSFHLFSMAKYTKTCLWGELWSKLRRKIFPPELTTLHW